MNSEWSAFGNSGSGQVRNSELGTTFGGHSDLGAQSGRKYQPACWSLCVADSLCSWWVQHICLSPYVRTSRGRSPLSEANHRGTLALSFQTPRRMPSTLSTLEEAEPTFALGDESKPAPPSLLERRSPADASYMTVPHARPPLGSRVSSHTATSDSHNNSVFIDLTSEPTNGCSDSSKTG